jgi:hypothetical protein
MQGNDIFGVATSAPFDPSLGINNVYFSTPGKSWSTGNSIAPTALIFAGAGDSLAKDYKAPGVAMFSLGVQHELAPSLIWVVQYVGNLAWHQNIVNNINTMSPGIGISNVAAPGAVKMLDPRCVSGDGSAKYTVNGQPVSAANPSPDAACTAGFNNNGGFNAFRQFQGYTGISQDQNQTNGSYNGFQTGLRVQNKWGLSGEIDYTYSHEIDVNSYDNGGGVNLSNPWFFKYDKGSGSLDRRNILSANYVYKLPIFNKNAGLLKSTLGGWEIAGTIIDESGLPVAPGDGAVDDPVGLGGAYTSRPNRMAGDISYKKTRTSWFNTDNFYAPTPAYDGGLNLGFGNAGKDALVGPGRVNFTTSLYKTFQIYDTASLTLRFESFNTFNHTEWNGINAGMSCAPGTGQIATRPCTDQSNYGQVTGTWDPRNLELGAKFVF